MQIEKISISKLNPEKYNPRKDLKPGDAEYEKLKRSVVLALDKLKEKALNVVLHTFFTQTQKDLISEKRLLMPVFI